MASFGPYIVTGVIPAVTVDTRGPARRLFRLHGGEPQGRNVWILSDGTAVDQQPQATYAADGSLALTGSERTVRFMQGPMVHSITAAEATILTTSGFGSYVT